MNEYNISNREMRLAQTVTRKLQNSLARRNLKPAFSDFYITNLGGMTPLIAVLDVTKLGDHRPYTSPDLLHQLSTDLGGLPVYLANHSGIRYVVMLTPLPKLPRKIDLPLDAPRGKVALGVRYSGQPVVLSWETLTHLAVLGATGSGKSVFLQSLTYQAIRDEMSLMLADIDQSTFGMLEGHPNLAAPIASTPADAHGLIEQALAECDQRAELFKSLPERPQKLSEYNALAVKGRRDPLPRMLVVLDEASSVLTSLGGARGAMGQSLATLGWRGRKFGIHFVFAAQEFTKDILGPVRDQVGLSLCFRVKNGLMAERMGCKGAERIPVARPGLAISDLYGPIQTYYLDPALMAGGAKPFALNLQEEGIARRALAETGGKISLEVLTRWGLGQQEARRLQEDWKLRGWAANDPQRANALYILPKLEDLLTNQQTQQAQQTALQPSPAVLQPSPAVLQPSPPPPIAPDIELERVTGQARKEGGKVTRALVMLVLGISEWQARKKIEAWASLGLIEKDPAQSNAYVLKLKGDAS